jgi:two-component system LytT family response regulator
MPTQSLTAVIIDDVEMARKALRADLEDYCPDVHVVGEAEGVASGLEAIRSLKPDLVFLDIQMDDGTGFDLLKQAAGQHFQVIFTTAYSDFAIKAFRFSAVDYLLKPIDGEDLAAAVKKAKEMAAAPSPSLPPSYELLMENLRQMGQHKARKIALNTQEKVHIVPMDDIVRLESHSNYTLFYLRDGQKILVTRTLKEYEELFGSHNFLRIHNSHLINLDFLKEFVKADGGTAIMADNSHVPVSSRKKDILLKKLSEL